MISFSYDPEAGTLYCYFTELEMGQAVAELEYPVSLLLDADDHIIGLRLDLDDDITLDQLELALDHVTVRLDMRYGHLYAGITDEAATRTVPLEEPALLDLDGDDRILGVDVAIPADFRTAEHLQRLAPHLLALDETADVTTGQHPAPVDAAQRPPPAVPGDTQTPLRVGFVALVGKPNVGKSTLLNALLGQKVAIVSKHPQTTRVPLRGILNRPDAQIIFIDTPGIHEPRHRLGQFMVELARRAIPDADVVCMMVDISVPPSQLDQRIAALVRRARVPRLLILNKVDLRPRGGTHLEAYRELGLWDMEIAISAQTGRGLPGLVDEIVARLPYGERLYPVDQIAEQSEQQLVAELVREKVLRYTSQEVPHSVAVEVEEWQEKDDTIYIRLTINVEKESQKGIVIGAGGEMLKRIGSAARTDVERVLGRPVYLDLWVKTRPKWRNDPAALGWLGYRLKDWQ